MRPWCPNLNVLLRLGERRHQGFIGQGRGRIRNRRGHQGLRIPLIEGSIARLGELNNDRQHVAIRIGITTVGALRSGGVRIERAGSLDLVRGGRRLGNRCGPPPGSRTGNPPLSPHADARRDCEHQHRQRQAGSATTGK